MYNNLYKNVAKSISNKCYECNKYYKKVIIVNCTLICSRCYLKKYGYETKTLV